MPTPSHDPFLLRPGADTARASRLPRVHERFDERFIQELLVEHPSLLPVSLLQPDVGELICIGREVPTRDSGTIDNLYLSTSGYVIVVETKLWRNPQSRREVFSQVLDYLKDVVTRDFHWMEDVWDAFRTQRSLPGERLLEVVQRLAADEDFDEAAFIDRVHRGLERGHVISLIVGDGIDTRLQQLVSHLCSTTAHLRYFLGLVSLRCYNLPEDGGMLVIPELVQEVEPVQRAYVRIEVADELAGQIQVRSIVTESSESRPPRAGRATLDEDELFDSLTEAIGDAFTQRVRQFVDKLIDAGMEPDYKSAMLMLKVPDPDGEARSASLLAIEKSGLIFNSSHGPRQMERWGWDSNAVDRTVLAYFRRLHAIDQRFSPSGISHLGRSQFLPLGEVATQLDAIAQATEQAIASIQSEAERR